MNEQVAKNLRKLAAGLPDVWIYKEVPTIKMLQGKNLPVKALIDSKGNDIKNDSTCKVKEWRCVKADHFERLKAIWQQQGEMGVTKYCAAAFIEGKKQANDLKRRPHAHPDYNHKKAKLIVRWENFCIWVRKQFNKLNFR